MQLCHGRDRRADAHAVLRRLAEVRKDAKTQLSVRHEHGKPVGVFSVVLSTQHAHQRQASADILEVLPKGPITDAADWSVKPTGTSVIGGLMGMRA